MGKLIYAEKINDRIDEEECRRIEPAWYDGLDTCRKIIEDLPAVDAVPVEWMSKFCEDDIAEDQREAIVWMLKVWKRNRRRDNG